MTWTQFWKCIRRRFHDILPRLSELGLSELVAHRARMQGEPKGWKVGVGGPYGSG